MPRPFCLPPDTIILYYGSFFARLSFPEKTRIGKRAFVYYWALLRCLNMVDLLLPFRDERRCYLRHHTQYGYRFVGISKAWKIKKQEESLQFLTAV